MIRNFRIDAAEKHSWICNAKQSSTIPISHNEWSNKHLKFTYIHSKSIPFEVETFFDKILNRYAEPECVFQEQTIHLMIIRSLHKILLIVFDSIFRNEWIMLMWLRLGISKDVNSIRTCQLSNVMERGSFKLPPAVLLILIRLGRSTALYPIIHAIHTSHYQRCWLIISTQCTVS